MVVVTGGVVTTCGGDTTEETGVGAVAESSEQLAKDTIRTGIPTSKIIDRVALALVGTSGFN